jgi:purine nucleoside permease
LERRDKAEEFWVTMTGGDRAHDATLGALAKMADAGNVNVFDRVALLIKAWNVWVEKGKTTPKTVELKYEVDEFGVPHLVETPVLDGLDQGPARA